MRRRVSIAFGFLALIAVGAIVLSSPQARNAGAWGNFSSALFTATSAVCVTGLTVVDIAREYSRFGQIVLMVLVEFGCLGLMTLGTFLLVAIGRRLSLSREFSLMNAYGVTQIRGLKGLILWIIGSMVVIEGVGAALLYLRFHDWYQAAFFSVMSFCNAGFSILPGSISSFARDPYVVGVMALETILGGIGFLVIFNLCTFKFLRRMSGARGRLTLHTKVVLRVTLYLLVFAFVVFLALEWNGSLAIYGFSDRLTVGFFQAVTPRTCGFTIVPVESLKPLTRLVYEVLMFIGGGPGSAAAGIKVTTLAVIVYTLRAMCRGEQETVISGRSVSYDAVRESIIIVVTLASFIWLVVAALTMTEAGGEVGVQDLFFEAVSAITTTGLSVGDTTASLSPAGRAVIMVAMFIGRLGALSVVMLIGDREANKHLRYPHEELVVG